MSKKRQERLNALLDAGNQAAYEEGLSEQRDRRNGRLRDREDTAARRAAEADLETLTDQAISRDGFDPDLDLE